MLSFTPMILFASYIASLCSQSLECAFTIIGKVSSMKYAWLHAWHDTMVERKTDESVLMCWHRNMVNNWNSTCIKSPTMYQWCKIMSSLLTWYCNQNPTVSLFLHNFVPNLASFVLQSKLKPRKCFTAISCSAWIGEAPSRIIWLLSIFNTPGIWSCPIIIFHFKDKIGSRVNQIDGLFFAWNHGIDRYWIAVAWALLARSLSQWDGNRIIIKWIE